MGNGLKDIETGTARSAGFNVLQIASLLSLCHDTR
jgi:hypothetical protein